MLTRSPKAESFPTHGDAHGAAEPRRRRSRVDGVRPYRCVMALPAHDCRGARMVARGNSEPHAAGVPNGTPDLPCIQVHSRWSWRRITGAPPLPRCRAVASKAPPTRRAPERFTCGVRRRSAASAWRPAQPCRALPRPSDVPRETAGHAARANDAALSGPSAYGPTATPLCPHNGSPPDRQPAPEVGRRCTAAASKRCGHQPERAREPTLVAADAPTTPARASSTSATDPGRRAP